VSQFQSRIQEDYGNLRGGIDCSRANHSRSANGTGLLMYVFLNQLLEVGRLDGRQLEPRRDVDAATRDGEAGVVTPNLRVRCETNVCRVLSANSPTGCSAKSACHGSRLRARRGGPVRGHPRAR
jgi:hypothetical protein